MARLLLSLTTAFHNGNLRQESKEFTLVRAALVGLVTLALLGPVHAAQGQTPDNTLEGVYTCQGTNPDGSSYAGVVEIVKRKEAYLVRWTMPDESQVVGVGIFSGSQLAVSYFGGTPAVVLYSIAENGTLNGKWTAGGADGSVFQETLTRLPEGATTPKPTKRESRPRSRITV
jgi:hypothetical protein